MNLVNEFQINGTFMISTKFLVKVIHVPFLIKKLINV